LNSGKLVYFIDNCEAILEIPQNGEHRQMPLWPTSVINAGEIGLLLKAQYCEEVGTLCEILVGNDIFYDVPGRKIEFV